MHHKKSSTAHTMFSNVMSELCTCIASSAQWMLPRWQCLQMIFLVLYASAFALRAPLIHICTRCYWLHNVTGTIWHNAMPYYSHASHIGRETDSYSKSSNRSLNSNVTSSSGKSGISQQRRMAVYTLQCRQFTSVLTHACPPVFEYRHCREQE